MKALSSDSKHFDTTLPLEDSIEKDLSSHMRRDKDRKGNGERETGSNLSPSSENDTVTAALKDKVFCICIAENICIKGGPG